MGAGFGRCWWLAPCAGHLAPAITSSRNGGDEVEELGAWARGWGQLTPERAAAFLDCDGLGDDHIFWPMFREALKSEGVLGVTTLQLAVRKWGEWENYQEQMVEKGQLSGNSIITVPGLNYLNGSEVELHINGLIDLPVIFQKAAYSHLFDTPPKWGADYAGFLACPIGFVLVQYVIFIANKVRNPLGTSLLKDYWEGMVNAFGLIYAVPSYVLDHSESVFQLSGSSPSAPRKKQLSQLQRHPPPRGFEEFFAKLARDPLVQVPNCEAQWLEELGAKNLRKPKAKDAKDAKV